MQIKITIGDWSKDGHEQYEEFVFESNKTVEQVRQAYKDSCKLTGLQFNHGENYTGLKEHDSYRTKLKICTEYQDSEISVEALQILNKHNISVFEHIFEDEDTEYFLDADVFLKLLLDFIKLSLPDLILEEASFKKSELRDMPAVNGWWNGELNVQFGYGLFD